MYYRMTRLHFEEDAFADLVGWAESVRGRVEAIEGLMFADLIRGGPGDGMIIAAYNEEASFAAASDEMAAILDEMGGYLTDTPHGHAGTVALSYGR